MQTLRKLLDGLNVWITEVLSRPIQGFEPATTYSVDQLSAMLQPGDVLLVEGNLRISSVIKYITQSTWSHVALYVGPQPGARGDDLPVLVEAELTQGVILSPLSKYVNFHTRICRPIGLRPEDRERVVSHGIAGLTKTVALEVATMGITMNAICPGYVWTPLVEKQIPDTAKARGLTEAQVISDVLLHAQPTKQFVQVGEVAALAMFLASDAAASITGTIIPIDGGWTAQ